MDEQLMEQLVAEVVSRLAQARDPQGEIPVEVSARHVHLTAQDTERLFGKGHRLTLKRELSQPGEFLCEERVRIVTAQGTIGNVAVLGPARAATQAELSLTDGRALGLTLPVNLSGDLGGAADVVLVGSAGSVEAHGCAIAAQRHLHMTPEDAARFGLRDGARVGVRIASARPVVFEDVAVRVRETFALALHIDADEANACAWAPGVCAQPVRAFAPAAPLPAAEPAPPRACDEKLITEQDARQIALRAPGGEIRLRRGAIVTPAAADVLRAAGVRVQKEARGC